MHRCMYLCILYTRVTYSIMNPRTTTFKHRWTDGLICFSSIISKFHFLDPENFVKGSYKVTFLEERPYELNRRSDL